jgi:hypothetical protein
MIKKHWLYAVTACLACVVAVEIVLLTRNGFDWSALYRATVFYGLVTDAQGRPLEGAKIEVLTGPLANEPIVGEGAMEKKSARRAVVASGPDGRFSVSLPRGHKVLTVKGVTKPGFSWVFDVVWGMGTKYDRHSNKEFVFATSNADESGYFPDASKPAIFPMYGATDATLAQYPSRGGAGRNPGTGKVEPNLPVKPALPSAGPGAPNLDSKSIGRAISEYLSSPSR